MKPRSLRSKFTLYEMKVKREIIGQTLAVRFYSISERVDRSGTQRTSRGHSSFGGELWFLCPEERPGTHPRDCGRKKARTRAIPALSV